jgi:hypothetical protein
MTHYSFQSGWLGAPSGTIAALADPLSLAGVGNGDTGMLIATGTRIARFETPSQPPRCQATNLTHPLAMRG